MKGRFWRKALAAALALLIVSGSAPIKPITDVFGDIAITANAESDTIVIEASGQTISDVTTWENCVVNITGSDTVTFSNRISISGNVTLNLEAGITLNASKGIAVHEGNSLTIDGEGTLNANIGYKEYYGAAIGGSNGINAGTIIINGGNINAYGKYYAAAIGGGYHSNGGNIIINGGTVNADSETGKADGAGIGGGICGDGGNITINGGDITTKSYTGTGLGGGYKGSGGNITITGGNVTSTAGNHAAGIGGGCFGNAGTITITGGIINVTSGADGAGIGGGGTSDENPAGSGGTISINGGQITVTSSGGYGIGAGKSNYNNNNNGAEGTITLSWNESTDFINASSYKGTISFVEGKRFYYDGTTDYVTEDELASRLNQKIVPAVADNNSLAYADIQMPLYYITTNGTAVDVSYDVYDYNGNKLTKGTHYTAVIKNSSNEEVSSFDQLGDYTLTVMLSSKTKPIVKIGIVENDMAMQVRLIMVNGYHILIIAFQITVAKLLSDLHSLFGRDFTGGKALYHVVGKDLCSPCSCVSDGSEVLACSCAIGSASIRVDIYTAPGLIDLCDVSDCCADCCPDRMDRSVCQISFTPSLIC